MLEDYTETVVILSPSGELLLALPIYANQTGALFNESEMKALTGVSVAIGCYEKFGYLLYHPGQDFSFYMQSIELFENLGKL